MIFVCLLKKGRRWQYVYFNNETILLNNSKEQMQAKVMYAISADAGFDLSWQSASCRTIDHRMIFHRQKKISIFDLYTTPINQFGVRTFNGFRRTAAYTAALQQPCIMWPTWMRPESGARVKSQEMERTCKYWKVIMQYTTHAVVCLSAFSYMNLSFEAANGLCYSWLVTKPSIRVYYFFSSL